MNNNDKKKQKDRLKINKINKIKYRDKQIRQI